MAVSPQHFTQVDGLRVQFRVRGQGIKKAEHQGDLIVEVEIIVPEKLTEEQERMMREFAEAGGLKY